MGNNTALAVENVGDAVLADLHPRHEVPDQLEIDLGDAHTGVKAGAGDRQRHIGFAEIDRLFTAEIDRAVISLFSYRLGEFRVV
jgi:hypothetical protein